MLKEVFIAEVNGENLVELNFGSVPEALLLSVSLFSGN